MLVYVMLGVGLSTAMVGDPFNNGGEGISRNADRDMLMTERVVTFFIIGTCIYVRRNICMRLCVFEGRVRRRSCCRVV